MGQTDSKWLNFATMKYADFRQNLAKLQDRLFSVADSKGKKLILEIVDGTDRTIFWKLSIRIKCCKVHAQTGVEESVRVLRLHEFMDLQKFLRHIEPDDHSLVDSEELSVSMIFAHVDASGKLPVPGGCRNFPEERECCICADRAPESMLPCHHSYCNKCINEWRQRSETCPLCRQHVGRSDEHWVIPQVPDEHTIKQEMNDSLLSVADGMGRPDVH